ncbi:M20 family metallopeptidase [soil metagenome]
MTADLSTPGLAELRRTVESFLPDFLHDLERLVNVDCGSYTRSGVDEVGSWTGNRLEALGARVERRPGGDLGDTVVGTFEGHSTGPTVLLIGHLDTVFDPGTAAARPFATRDGRAYGPGVSDMKSGLLGGLYALAALRALGQRDAPADWLPVGRVVFVANPDEEIGSPVSGPIIRQLAAHADVALVLEGARANGDIVSARKGVSDIRLTLRGRAAHAGIEPEKGRSAVLEAAHKIVALHGLNGRWPGVTINAGVVRGGTRANIVPEEASIIVDLRAVRRADQEAAEAAIDEIAHASTVPDVATSTEVVARHWPMEKQDAAARLVDLAVGLAAELGFELNDAATGGASDANTTSGMGVPTLDGLGPVGGEDHAPGEYIELGSIVPRTTLLAGLLAALGDAYRRS